MKNLVRSAKLLYKISPIMTALLGLITAFFIIISPLYSIIDKLIFDTLQSNYIAGITAKNILSIVLAYFIYNLAMFAIDKAKQHIQTALGIKIRSSIQNGAMRGMLDIDYEKYEDNEFYNYLSTITREIDGDNTLKLYINAMEVIGAVFTTAYLGAILYQLGPVPMLVSLLCCVPGFVHHYTFGNKNWEFNMDKAPLKRKLGYVFSTLSSVGTYKENRIFNTTRHYQGKYNNLFKDYYSMLQKFNSQNCWKGILAAVVHSLGTVGVIAYAYYSAAVGDMTLGDAVMFVGISQSAYNVIQNIVFYGGTINETKNSVDNILSLNTKIESAPGEVYGEMAGEAMSIELDGVKYAYPGSAKNAIDGISLKLDGSKKVAIVGENGSGKTTLIKLILGLYRPGEGTIRIGGQAVSGNRLRYASACFQDYYTYAFTVRENVGFGYIEKLNDDGEIMRAIDMGKLAPESFGNDLERYVTRTFDSNGVQFSGGQSQKLSLARSFMYGRGIIALDEPSASLDVVTENEIFESTLALMEGRLAIVITHRLANVIKCDTILYLEDGRVVEQGSHDELMRAKGRYYDLFMIQAEKYGERVG